MIISIYLSNASKHSTFDTTMAFVHCFSVGYQYLPKLVRFHLSAILKGFYSSDIHEVLLKWTYDQKIISFFPSDFESVLA